MEILHLQELNFQTMISAVRLIYAAILLYLVKSDVSSLLVFIHIDFFKKSRFRTVSLIS